MKQYKKAKVRKIHNIQQDIENDLNTAIDRLKEKRHPRKFDESVDIVIQLVKDVIKTDKVIRGLVKLTYKLPKEKKIIVFSDNINDIKLAKESGVYLTGGIELVEEIKETKKIDCEIVITTPEFIENLNIIGSILGPKRLMPNLALGTITKNISDKISAIKSGEIFFTIDKYGNIHGSIGKISFPSDHLYSNIKDIYNAVNKHFNFKKDSKLISNIYISTTMGPSIKIRKIIM